MPVVRIARTTRAAPTLESVQVHVRMVPAETAAGHAPVLHQRNRFSLLVTVLPTEAAAHLGAVAVVAGPIDTLI